MRENKIRGLLLILVIIFVLLSVISTLLMLIGIFGFGNFNLYLIIFSVTSWITLSLIFKKKKSALIGVYICLWTFVPMLIATGLYEVYANQQSFFVRVFGTIMIVIGCGLIPLFLTWYFKSSKIVKNTFVR